VSVSNLARAPPEAPADPRPPGLVRGVLTLARQEGPMTFAYGRSLLVAGGLAVALAAVDSHDAVACGCFTPPDPSVPVVQAGERILFSIDNGNVTAHIQIQYSGNASEFGWLLPLPSVPTLQLGTDELFANLISTTQPKYRLVTTYQGNCGFQPRGLQTFGPGGGTAAPSVGNASVDGSSPLVIQDSIGPYDYAVLKADSQADMLQWLQDNRYFVPAGTDQTVSAYIHPGAYFLALKLRSGQSAGDLQPVVVNYPSDKPMIPIVLTSVAAQPNMGVQVWMLGEGRAIPVNYYHTVINDLAIDWGNAGQNYNDVIIASVGQAPQKHAFVTEYAGTSSIMQNKINYTGRFGSQAELAANTDPIAFVGYLQTHGFTFTSQLDAILGRSIPYPTGLAQYGVTQANFYANLSYYTSASAMQQYPAAAYAGWPGITSFDPVATAQEIQDKIVQPTVDAAALFDKYSRLTRLYTTLSPEDMTLDPVFSFNPTLPDVAKDHQATLTYYCGLGHTDRATAPATLTTEQGWTRDFPSGTGTSVLPAPPAGLTARRLEVLGEEGPPNVVMDNAPNSGCGCALGNEGGSPAGGALLGATVGLAAAVAMRLRRRSQRRAR
jgi:hypothetical protein